MAVNRYDRRRFSLLDHNGPWCAWCLKTIRKGQPVEIHHMLPTANLEYLLKLSFPLPWTVPAHRHRCHRPWLHIPSGGLSDFLRRALALPVPELASLNSRLHELGFYWFPVLTYGHRLKRRGPDSDSQAAHFFSSAAGVRQGRKFAEKISGRFSRPRNADTLINMSNLEFTSGDLHESRGYLENAASPMSSSGRRTRDAQTAAFLRRKAQLELDSAAASEAQALSASNAYTARTAILQQGWISLTRGQVAKAMTHFESLEEKPNPTWLYRAEVLFAHALCSLAVKRGTDEELYACLVTAQYLYAMLGIVGTSQRFLSYIGDRARFGRTPTDALLDSHHFDRFSPEQCFEIRQMAISGKGRARLLATVLGDQNLGDTLFDGLRHALPEGV